MHFTVAFPTKRKESTGESKGVRRSCPLPPPKRGQNSLNFMQFLRKFGKILCSRPPITPPPRLDIGDILDPLERSMFIAKMTWWPDESWWELRFAERWQQSAGSWRNVLHCGISSLESHDISQLVRNILIAKTYLGAFNQGKCSNRTVYFNAVSVAQPCKTLLW